MPAEFEAALSSLGRRRKIALRQLLRFFAEGRVADEVAALEVLGRLSGQEDDATLSRVVNDPSAPEGARVACGLVLLGHDRADLIRSSDVSGLVLRWQARYVAEEPSLRGPLTRLYATASRVERASWAALQDRELSEPEGRAAVFEMLLQIEEDPDLRSFLLEALSRVPDPSCRAALRRVEAQGPEERDFITGALAAMAAAADPDRVPAGWTARIGFCDGTGSFPLRFDFTHPTRRPRSTVFVVNLESGVREALPLSGGEVQRYDELGPRFEAAAGEPPPMMFPLPVADALGLLSDAERADRRENRVPPRDYPRARRLLDPLADVRPRWPDPLPNPLSFAEVRRTADLLEHPGYAGWFYDAGDQVLDDLRLEVLHAGHPQADDGVVTRAAERLVRSGEPRRLLRMIRHNALVHRLAGEPDVAGLAMAASASITAGGFVGLPLVRRMLRESLHPGHYFFTPMPEVPDRLEFAANLVGDHRPTKLRVIAVDLALALARAFEVWLSRTPSGERPHGDLVQSAVAALAQAGARTIARGGAALAATALPAEGRPHGDAFPAELRARLRRRYEAVLATSTFPRLRSDPGHTRLLDLAVRATEALVTRCCLGSCPQRCPVDPRGSGREALLAGRFPAGYEAELYVRTWPGVFLHEPTPAQRAALSAFIKRPPLKAARGGRSAEPFVCGLCGDERPGTARARSLLVPHDGSEAEPVCRKCRDRYRRDPAFRAETMVRRGKLL